MSPRTNAAWSGFLRFTSSLLAIIAIIGLIVFGLGVAYAIQLHSAPLDISKWNHPKDHRWSSAWFIFYSCFFPFLTLVHGLIDTFCFALGSLYPMYALVVSATFLIGWIVQISFWFQCDYFPDYTKCYQFYVVGRSDSQSAGSLVGVSDGVTAAKVALGMVLLVLYFLYFSFAALAVRERSKTDPVVADGIKLKEPEVESE